MSERFTTFKERSAARSTPRLVPLGRRRPARRGVAPLRRRRSVADLASRTTAGARSTRAGATSCCRARRLRRSSTPRCSLGRCLSRGSGAAARRPAARGRAWQAFRRYLSDFPRLQEAPPASLELWERYLVYGIAFGIADRVLQGAQLAHAPGDARGELALLDLERRRSRLRRHAHGDRRPGVGLRRRARAPELRRWRRRRAASRAAAAEAAAAAAAAASARRTASYGAHPQAP